MSVKMRMRLFKNNNKEPGVAYTAGLWKDEKNDSLNLRVDEKKLPMSEGGGTPMQPRQPEPAEDIPF